MALRVSEKEAIARGWIKAPEPPPPVPARHHGRRQIPGSLSSALIFIAGWLIGFAMATMFPR